MNIIDVDEFDEALFVQVRFCFSFRFSLLPFFHFCTIVVSIGFAIELIKLSDLMTVKHYDAFNYDLINNVQFIWHLNLDFCVSATKLTMWFNDKKFIPSGGNSANQQSLIYSFYIKILSCYRCKTIVIYCVLEAMNCQNYK